MRCWCLSVITFLFVYVGICLHCIAVDAKQGMCRRLKFNTPTQGFALQGHVLKNLSIEENASCKNLCTMESRCVSFNLGPSIKNKMVCELSDSDHTKHPEDLKPREGFVYRGTENPCTNNICSQNGKCLNGYTDKRYFCECKAGFTGQHCDVKDVDECNDAIHDCHVNASCTNTIGSFNCSCKKGYAGNGRSCADVDECAMDKHNCSPDGDCSNVIGSYQCTYVDECTTNKHDCSSDGGCTNTMGSYQCTCNPGFTGDGRTCQDIDECNDGSHNCHFAAICTNTAGSFGCSCKSGHLGDGRHFCSDNWKKVNINPICFGTKNDDYGPFPIQEAGKIYTFKLFHTKGSVTCDTNEPNTKWGCKRSQFGTHNLLTVITYSNRTVLLLAQFVKGGSSTYYTYKLDGADVNSQTLVFNLLPNPMDVSVGQQFQIWYGHDLVDYTENNNAGRTCADVYGLYPL